ncbi:MAG: ATP-binding protein [Bdellovibrionota bacterium]|jgi:hypothetical protein
MQEVVKESNYKPRQEHFIGSVFQVGLSSIQFSFSSLSNSNKNSENRETPLTIPTDVGVGDYVVIACLNHSTLGQITDMQIKATSTSNGKQALPIATVELFASMSYADGMISSGIKGSPKLSARVYVAPPELIQRITTSNYQRPDEVQDVLLEVGALPNQEETPLFFSPDSLFGRHLAIVGTTGSGKSWSIARILQETAKFNSKVILFDASGEFSDMPKGTIHVSIGLDPDPPKHVYQVSVPYTELRESDLFAIFKPTGRSQFPKLRQAIKSLKLAKLAPHIAIDGLIIKAHRTKLDYEEEYRRFAAELESPTANFNIHCLSEQIENECVNPQRSQLETGTWGGPNSEDFSDCVPLINRINDIIHSPNLSPIFNPGKKHSLFTVIKHFLTDDSQRILRISLQYLSFDHNAREIIANAIGRHLLEIARSGFFRQQPLLVVVDEAHQFLNDNILTGGHFPLDSFGFIAKEGRKYAINICLATQRPRDIPEGVISQMGTLIVHRLINDHDRQLIERASASMDHNTAESIPVLAPGDAIILGVNFPIPLLMKITPPQNRPNSRGPEYQKFWRKTKPEVKTELE